jgi:murein DD-endopeptidase MepM/ murein hydrolase activator NlpD
MAGPLTGRVSWFGGPHDPSAGPTMATGKPTSAGGIAVYNQGTLGGYWRLHFPNGRAVVLQQNDIGPAPWTGRKFDVNYASLGSAGYNEGNFPTNANVTGEYLGRQLPQGVALGHPERSSPSHTAGTPPHLETGEGSAAQNASIAALASLLTQQNTPSGYGGLLPRPGSGEEQAGPKLPAEAAQGPQQSHLAEALALVDRIGQQAPGTNVVPGTPGTSTPGAQGYVNPHPGATLGRTDMGVDYNLKPGAPIRAIGNARVLGVGSNWFPGHGNPMGSPYIAYQLESGPQKGKIVYVAEEVNPSVRAGEHVRAGQPVGTYASSGTGIEEGWGSPQLETTEAAATTGYHEGEATKAGQSFRRFLESLGR